MKYFAATLCLLASASSVVSHATFQYFFVNGVDKVDTCVRKPPSNNPVQDVTSNDLRCNVHGGTGVPGVCSVPAGASLTVEMHQQTNVRTNSTPCIDVYHLGPVTIWLTKVTDSKSADGSTPWFKISQESFDPTTGYAATGQKGTWGVNTLIQKGGKHDFVMPPSLASGDYLLRAEVLALHKGGDVGGAQFFMSCYQVTVTGGGYATPAGVSIPGAYHATDPGIHFNIYQPIKNYTAPGPTDIYTT